ncbi:NB-ARC domain-containing protein, partial [Dactylosporangium sp. NPDC005572]|uniref:NB-ARC domain-containing protein n=1 Tax=Dactylosporangium sp. NPDC005572 TaxID=3156889 RepID=UPI0033B88909
MAFFVGALANVFTTGWNWPVGLSLGVLVLVWVFWEVRRAAHLTAGLSPVAADTATVGPERIRSAGVAIVPMRSGFDETGPQPLADLNPPSPGGGSQRGSWPHQVGIVPNPADCYRHREITDQLSPDATEWISGTQILSGMGGVGKSQLAAAVVRHYWNSGQVDLAVWLNAGSRAAIIAGYAQAGVETTAGDGHNEEACARRFLAWLARTSRRWIIVLDDLNEPSDLGGWWPPLSPQGRVLVTTRRRDATLRGRGTLIDVGMFSPAEAVGYLRQKLGEPHERTEPIARLAEDVGFLPLALAQAAAYIVDRGIDCAAYRSRFANQSLRLSELLPEPSALPDDHRDVLAVTWSLSVDAANQLDPPGLARPLLLVLSLGDPNGLPLAVLHCPPVLGFFGEARGTDRPATADEASDALHCLYRLNLATPVNIQQHRAVQVHGLVQRASREQAPPAQLDGAARALALALVESWPDVEADAVLGRLLRVTTASLHRHAPDVLWSDEQRELLFRYGRSLGEAGAVAPASDYFRRMATDALRRLGPEHPATLRARSRSAGWRGRAGDPAGAANAFDIVFDAAISPDERWMATAG